MSLAVEAGRLAYLAGRIPRKMYATASSPVEGLVGPLDAMLTRPVDRPTTLARLRTSATRPTAATTRR